MLLTFTFPHFKILISKGPNFFALFKVTWIFDDVAYMQVKDLTKNENEKVFIFNGWTFSSDPNLSPFDHAIYDLQLLNCYNV